MKEYREDTNAASGSGRKKRRYVYFHQLEFLKKNATPAVTENSLEGLNNAGELPFNETTATSIENSTPGKPSKSKRKKNYNGNEFEEELLKRLDNPTQENQHVSFIKGIMPTLNTLDQDEIFEWQHQALNSLHAIKARKMQSQAYARSQTHPYENPGPFYSQIQHSQNVYNPTNFGGPALPQTPSNNMPLPSPQESLQSECSSIIDILGN